MKYIEILQEFLKEELEDYSAFRYEIHLEGENSDHESYSVDFSLHNNHYTSVRFRVFQEEIMVQVQEDGSFYETNTHSYKVKYFWQAFLSWN